MKLAVKRALLSAVIYPGLGQIKNGQKIKGVIFMVVATALVVALLYKFGVMMGDYFRTIQSFADPAGDFSLQRSIFTFWGRMLKVFAFFLFMGLIVWGAAGLDAYLSAKRKWGDVDDEESSGSGSTDQRLP